MTKDQLMVPGAIVVAGLLIAGAVIFVNQGGLPAQSDAGRVEQQESGEEIREVQDTDYIIGDSNAPIVVVEYSDLECPFCKNFHFTMKQVVDEYDGKVAWVYRHFPLVGLHPKAPKEAEAAECAGELRGSDGFWRFVDRLFEITPSNNGFNLDELPDVALYAGVDRDQFIACLERGEYAEKIQDHYNEAVAAGGRGTPFSVLVLSEPLSGSAREYVEGIIAPYVQRGSVPPFTIISDRQVSVGGAFPIDSLRPIIDKLLEG